jgi:RimJ/RimL family protein N-acetyltransferase
MTGVATDALRTHRLALHPIKPSDAAALYPLMTWNVVRWLSGPPWPLSLVDVTTHLAKSEADMRAGITMSYTIVASGAPCGAIDIRPMRGAMNLGYWLAEPHWGKGIMSEAARAIVDAFFDTNPAPHLACGAFAGNAASLRIQGKLGFTVVAENFLLSRPRGRLLPHMETMLGRVSWERRLAREETAVSPVLALSNRRMRPAQPRGSPEG